MTARILLFLFVFSLVRALDIIPGKAFDRFITIWLENQVSSYLRVPMTLAPLTDFNLQGLRKGNRQPSYRRNKARRHYSDAILRPNTPKSAQLPRGNLRRLLRPEP